MDVVEARCSDPTDTLRVAGDIRYTTSSSSDRPVGREVSRAHGVGPYKVSVRALVILSLAVLVQVPKISRSSRRFPVP